MGRGEYIPETPPYWSHRVTLLRNLLLILVLSSLGPTTTNESYLASSSPGGSSVSWCTFSEKSDPNGQVTKVVERKDASGHRSTKVTRARRLEPPLVTFLEKVLESRANLNWIDQAQAVDQAVDQARISDEAAPAVPASSKNHLSDNISTRGSRGTRYRSDEYYSPFLSSHQDAVEPAAEIDYGNKFDDKRAFDQTHQTFWLLCRKKHSDEDRERPNSPLRDYLRGYLHSLANDRQRPISQRTCVDKGGGGGSGECPAKRIASSSYRNESSSPANANWWNGPKTDPLLSLASLKKTLLKLRTDLADGMVRVQNRDKYLLPGKSRNKREDEENRDGGSGEELTVKRNEQGSDDALNGMKGSGTVIDLKNSEDEPRNGAAEAWEEKKERGRSVKGAKITEDQDEEAAAKPFERSGSLAATTKLEEEERKLEGAGGDGERLLEGRTEEEKRYLNEVWVKKRQKSGNKNGLMARYLARNRATIDTRILPDEITKDSRLPRNGSKDWANLRNASWHDCCCDGGPGTHSSSSDKQREKEKGNNIEQQQQRILREEGTGVAESGKNSEKSNVSRDLDMMEKKTENGQRAGGGEGVDDGPWGNSLQNIAVPRWDESQSDSPRTFGRGGGGRGGRETKGEDALDAAEARIVRTREKEGDVGSGRGAQVIKDVVGPQGHLFQNTAADTKESEGIGRDEEEVGKSYEQTPRDKEEPKGESGKIKIVVKSASARKKVVEFPSDWSSNLGQQPPSDISRATNPLEVLSLGREFPSRPLGLKTETYIADNSKDYLTRGKEPSDRPFHSQRRLLEIGVECERQDYQEYSSEAEKDDQQLSYRNGKEGDQEDQEQPLAESGARVTGRESRSAKEKVNVLIQQKMRRKSKRPTATDNLSRRRRSSADVIEYYDYDADADADADADLEKKDSESSLDDHRRPAYQSSSNSEARLETGSECRVCEPVAERKKNEHEEATNTENEQRAKLGNKGLKEEIIVDTHLDQNASKEATSRIRDPHRSASVGEASDADSGNFNRGSYKDSRYNEDRSPRVSIDDLKRRFRGTTDDSKEKGSATIQMEENTYMTYSAGYNRGASSNIRDGGKKFGSSQNCEAIGAELELPDGRNDHGVPAEKLGNLMISRSRKSVSEKERQVQPGSSDIEESFVEAPSWIDNFDDSSRIRLGRSLQTIDDNTLHSIQVGRDELVGQEQCRGMFLTTTETEIDVTPKASSIFEMITGAIDDSPRNMNEAGLAVAEERAGTKRDAESPDNGNPFYDQVELTQRHSNKLEDVEKSLKVGNSETSDYNDKTSIGSSQADHKGRRAAPISRRRHKGQRRRKQRQRQKQKHGRKGRGKQRKKRPQKHRHRRHYKGGGRHSGKNAGINQHEHKHKHNQMLKNQAKPKAAQLTNISKGEKREDQALLKNRKVARRAGHSPSRKMEWPILFTHDDRVEVEDALRIEDDALHEQLAGRIVDQIFNQVQSSDALKSSLGSGLQRQHKADDAIRVGQTYHQQPFGNAHVKRTEERLKQVIGILLSERALKQIPNNSCVSLSSDMNEFLDWLLGQLEKHNYTMTRNISLLFEESSGDHQTQTTLIRQSTPDKKILRGIHHLYSKVDLLEKLINEYNSLSEIDKEKVQPAVHLYLVKGLDLLLEYIEATEKEIGQVKSSSAIEGLLANIAAPNENESSTPAGSVSSGKSGPINEYFDNGLGNEDGDNRRKSRRAWTGRHRKRRRGQESWRGRFGEEGGGGYIAEKESSRQETAVLRRKREYNKGEEIRHSFDSEYAEAAAAAATYRSADTLNGKASGNKRATQSVLQKHRDDERSARGISDGGLEIYGEKGRHTNVMNSRQRAITRNLSNANTVLKNVPVARVEDLRNPASPSSYQPGRTSSVPPSTLVLSLLKLDHQGSSRGKNRPRAGVRSVAKQYGPVADTISLIINDTERNAALPIKGKNRLEDEVLLLNKREAWRRENEKQLEEVAFGKDMRNKHAEEKLFEQLTEIARKKSQSPRNHSQHYE